jgi:hypothetical protein
LQKLKQKNPFVTNTHCINHRLALASSDLLEQIPYLVEYVEIISDIHNFFSKSARRNLTLKENQIILDEDEKATRSQTSCHQFQLKLTNIQKPRRLISSLNSQISAMKSNMDI